MNLEEEKYLDIYSPNGSLDEAKLMKNDSLEGKYKTIQSDFSYYLDMFIILLSFINLIFYINLIINFKVSFN